MARELSKDKVNTPGSAAAERQAMDATIAPLDQAESQLRELTTENARLLAEVEKLRRRLTELQPYADYVAALQERVLACDSDYCAAFQLLREALPQVRGADGKLVFQNYLHHLREILAFAPGQAKGHFGSLQANRAFTDALTPTLNEFNLRLEHARGPATLNVTTPKGAPPHGYFQFNVKGLGLRGDAHSELPILQLVPKPGRGPS